MSSAAYDAKIEMQKLKYEQIKYENENKKEAEHKKNSWKAATLIRSDNDKWDEIREDLIKQIANKEEAVTGKSAHKVETTTTEEKGFLEK